MSTDDKASPVEGVVIRHDGCFGGRRRTMTLNMPAVEMALLEDMARRNTINKTAMIKRALRLLVYLQAAKDSGKRIVFSGDDGTYELVDV